DGWTDVVGLSAQRKPVFLNNDGNGRLIHRPQALGADNDDPANLVAVAVADLDGDGNPDLLLWSESTGLQWRRNRGNGNQGLVLALSGPRKRGHYALRSNADGLGVRVIAQTGRLWTAVENTTLSAGLGQSRTPLILGIGTNTQSDVVRLRWP